MTTNTNTNTNSLDLPASLNRATNGVTSQPAPAKTSAKPATKKAAAPKPAKTARKAKAAVAAVTGEGSQTKPPKSIVPKSYKDQYKAFGGTCGDNIATALKAATTTKNKDGRPCLDWPALKKIAQENKIDTKPYEGMNNGQKRMNIGNKMRGIVEQNGTVTINGKKYGTLSEATEANAARIKKAMDQHSGK